MKLLLDTHILLWAASDELPKVANPLIYAVIITRHTPRFCPLSSGPIGPVLGLFC